jgi:putative spermidine/putrescine transport system permease protein
MSQNQIRDPLQGRVRIVGTSLAVLVYAFLLLPLAIVVPIAFGPANDMSFPPTSFSTDLFAAFLSSPTWMDPLIQSVKVAVLSTAIVLILGVPAAYGISRYDFLGKKLIAGAMLSSLIIPTIVTALGLYLYFSYLRITGTTLALVLGHVIYTMPYVLVMIIAGVQKLDPNLEFGAQLMGAGRARMFRTVVLPQLVPSLLGAGLFAFLISFDEVVISWFLAGPSTTTLPVKMYSAIRWEISPVIAAVSTLLTALSFVVCTVMVVLRKTPGEG